LSHRELMSLALLMSVWNLTRWVESRAAVDPCPTVSVRLALAPTAAPPAAARTAPAATELARTLPASAPDLNAARPRPRTSPDPPAAAEARGLSPSLPPAPRA